MNERERTSFASSILKEWNESESTRKTYVESCPAVVDAVDRTGILLLLFLFLFLFGFGCVYIESLLLPSRFLVEASPVRISLSLSLRLMLLKRAFDVDDSQNHSYFASYLPLSLALASVISFSMLFDIFESHIHFGCFVFVLNSKPRLSRL